MIEMVAAVAPELLVKANKAVSNCSKGYDPIHSIVITLSDTYKPNELTAAYFRLKALAKIVKDGPKNAWVIKLTGKKYSLVNEVMYRAAATAPCRLDATGDELEFDEAELFRIALLESDIDGQA
jgi:hypothetical protein